MPPTAKRGSHALDSPTLAAQVFPKSAAPVSFGKIQGPGGFQDFQAVRSTWNLENK